MPLDDRYPSPRVFLRHAAGLDTPVPAPSPADPQAALTAASRGSVHASIGELSAADLQLLEARRELEAMRSRMRHLEQALRTAGKVLAPYLAGGGR